MPIVLIDDYEPSVLIFQSILTLLMKYCTALKKNSWFGIIIIFTVYRELFSLRRVFESYHSSFLSIIYYEVYANKRHILVLIYFEAEKSLTSFMKQRTYFFRIDGS